MKQIKRIMTLHFENTLSGRQIAHATGLSRPTVSEYLKKVADTGLSYAALRELSQEDLEKLLAETPEISTSAEAGRLAVLKSKFPQFAKELKKSGVTRELLWREYRRTTPEGYQYSQFCHHFNAWSSTDPELSMHFDHAPGEELFIDFAGDLFVTLDPFSGEKRTFQVFVAVLGASQYTYVEATVDQTILSVLRALENALRYFDGTPRAVIPDNMKTAVTRACKYEPELNPQFADFAEYYRTAVLPARASRPKDKSLVETAVRQTYRWIYAPLRERSFHSIHEVNAAFRAQLQFYNSQEIRRLGISRQALFLELEKPVLKTLPELRYPLRICEEHKVAPDYHFVLSADKHYYSVPYLYSGERVRVFYDEKHVSVYLEGERIAVHPRDPRRGLYSTIAAHMPADHTFVKSWSAEKFQNWAAAIGEDTRAFIEALLSSKPHEQQAYKSSLGVLSLSKKYDGRLLNIACRKALNFGRLSYREVKSYVEELAKEERLSRTDKQYGIPFEHENVRGTSNYA